MLAYRRYRQLILGLGVVFILLVSGCVEIEETAETPPAPPQKEAPPKPKAPLNKPPAKKAAKPQAQSSRAKEKATVIKVIDGDTIRVRFADGHEEAVRYIGIDTPETRHPNVGVECYGKEASAANRRLVEGKIVELEKDVSDTDKYGRLLRYVWIGNRLINEQMVAQGYAVSSTYPPDVKYQDRFLTAQRAARQAGLGLWRACGGADTPAKKPAAPPPAAAPPVTGSGFKVPACAAGDCDCKDFGGNTDWATWFLNNHDPGNRHRLDGDKDGVACE